ncbi:hypothetical protein [Vibrio sp. STUT-A11]|uniref:hypothetical protein n=2 Tax=Vibrionaceae TaxID=641 RepID=UPI002231A270|nr:hypothetical protein [Vibrio sp. STUT-A11]
MATAQWLRFGGGVAHPLTRRYVNSAHYRLVFVFNQITEVNMNLSQIKTLLSKGEIKSNEVNPIIDSLAVSDLDKLSDGELITLKELLNSMLLLINDPNSGAYLNNQKKAELLFSSIK